MPNDYCDCPKAPGGVLEVDDMETKRHVVCGKEIGPMTNSEQGAGEGKFWCIHSDGRDHCYECEVSALQAKVADLEKEQSDMENVHQGEIEFLISRLQALEAALRSCISAAGCPDAGDGCRLIIKIADEALRPSQSPTTGGPA